MDITLGYKKDVLFIRLTGKLTKFHINKFNENIIPVIISIKSKNVVFNLENLKYIDDRGIDAIINISNLLKRLNGNITICGINGNIKEKIDKSIIKEFCFVSKNEETSLGVINI